MVDRASTTHDGAQVGDAEPVPDPYRWLEDPSSPHTRSWLTAQEALLHRHSQQHQAAETIWERCLTEVEAAAAGRLLTPPAEAGGTLFRHELTVAGGERLTASAGDGRDRVLLDTGGDSSVNRLATWRPDPMGRVVVAQLHRGGHENGGLLIVPVATGEEARQLPDAAPHTSVAFVGPMLLYSAGTRTEHTLRAHHLRDGTTRTVGLPVVGATRLSLHTGPEGHLLLRTRTPDASQPRWWCTRITGQDAPGWQRLRLEDLRITAFALGAGRLYIADEDLTLSALDLTRAAQGRVTQPVPVGSVPLESSPLGSPPARQAATAAGSIRALRVMGPNTELRLAVLSQIGTTRRLEVRRVATDGDMYATSAGPGKPNTDDGEPFTWHARLRLGPATYDHEGQPGNACWILADDPRYGALGRRVTAAASAVPTTRCSTLRTVTAASRDGTSVPVTVCDPPSEARQGPIPTLITVYGGFGVPLEPSWDPIVAAWLAAGGRIAWVHARGGGEYGPDWAAAGRGAGKSDTVDDLCAAGNALQELGEAGPGQLAALAASNGGLVLSAALVRSPRLFSAVACAAPLTDMARYDQGGLGKLWLEEYGDPTAPDSLRSLMTYSPYHHVQDGDNYPAVLFITGGNDARVRPWHAWKLCAALQDATSGSASILLDHQENTGHYGRAPDPERPRPRPAGRAHRSLRRPPPGGAPDAVLRTVSRARTGHEKLHMTSAHLHQSTGNPPPGTPACRGRRRSHQGPPRRRGRRDGAPLRGWIAVRVPGVRSPYGV